MADGWGGHWLVRMEWRPDGWSVCLPPLIFPCTTKSRSSLLAPAHPVGPGKRAVKRLWCGVAVVDSTRYGGVCAMVWRVRRGFAVGIYTTNSADACHYVLENSSCQIVVVENDYQLQKILQVKDRLPELRSIIQYKGEPPEDCLDVLSVRCLYSWRAVTDLNRGYMCNLLHAIIACSLLHAVNCTCNHV